MEVTFRINQSGATKRKHFRGACDKCRQRKRKCHHDKNPEYHLPNAHRGELGPSARSSHLSDGLESHIKGGLSRDPHCEDETGASDSQDRTAVPHQQAAQCRDAATPASGGTPANRFMGDLNPVVLFVNSAHARLLRGRTHQGDVGEWLEEDSDIQDDEDAHEKGPSRGYYEYQASRQQLGSQRGRNLLPPRQSQEALIDLYFRIIHPIIPLLDEDDFRTRFTEGSISRLLLQAVCLVASKDQAATPWLYLTNINGNLSLQEFSYLLAEDLKCSIASGVERKRLTMIQILALLSLHAPGPKSFEDASMFLVQAIHHAFTLGLHLTKGFQTPDEKHLIHLFWSLWSLDKWNSAIHGRPLVINDRDLGQQLGNVIHMFDPPFRVWLSLASTIGDVVTVYRPTLDSPVDGDKSEIPRFDDLLKDCRGWDIASEHLFFLELSYHAIAILASRPWGLKVQPRSPTLCLRQDLSGYRMRTLLQMCDVAQFPPLPTVSYSISLGFAISYKQLKRCQLPSTQYMAREHLRAFHDSLEALSPVWWSAKTMTRLGKRALGRVGFDVGGSREESGAVDIRKRTNDTENRCPQLADVSDNPARPHLAGESRTDKPSDIENPSGSPPVFGSARFGGDPELPGSAIDDMFGDVDVVLGDFLNINIPTGPIDPFFINPDTADMAEISEASGLYWSGNAE